MLGLESLGDSPLCNLGIESALFIDQTLFFTQSALLGYYREYETTNDLVLQQIIDYRNSWESNQTLLIEQAVEYGVNYVIPIIQSLNLQQTQVIGMVRGFEGINTLGLLQRIQISNVYNMALCHCISFQQQVRNAILLSVTQSLSFELLERDVLEHILYLTQLIETNMDDITCCSTGGSSPDRTSASDLVFAQLLSEQMVYNVAIAQSLGLLNTVAWSPQL